jgi:ABC-type cobalamin transport system ATPase subunit
MTLREQLQAKMDSLESLVLKMIKEVDESLAHISGRVDRLERQVADAQGLLNRMVLDGVKLRIDPEVDDSATVGCLSGRVNRIEAAQRQLLDRVERQRHDMVKLQLALREALEVFGARD